MFQKDLCAQIQWGAEKATFHGAGITLEDRNIKIIGMLLFNSRIHSPSSPCHRLWPANRFEGLTKKGYPHRPEWAMFLGVLPAILLINIIFLISAIHIGKFIVPSCKLVKVIEAS